MSKGALIARLRQEQPNLSAVQAGNLIESVTLAIVQELEGGNDVRIPGFGTFRRKFRDTRDVRNPRTGEITVKQGHHVITFKEARQRRK